MKKKKLTQGKLFNMQSDWLEMKHTREEKHLETYKTI